MHDDSPARTGPDGALIPMAEQDRGLWNAEYIAEGVALVSEALPRGPTGPYQLQAAIAAVHDEAPTAADTDWRQILELYDRLLAIAPTPVVVLNRAVALAEVAGPAAALEELQGIELDRYHLFHATRADLLRRLGRDAEAAEAYDAAITLATNTAERGFLERRRRELAAG